MQIIQFFVTYLFTLATFRTFAIRTVFVIAEGIKGFRLATFGTGLVLRGIAHRSLLTEVEKGTWLPAELAAETFYAR